MTPAGAWIWASVALLGGLLPSCGARPPAAKPGKRLVPEVRVEEAGLGPMTWEVAVSGEVVATNQVTLCATVEGLVSSCPFREGDRVGEGIQVATIDTSSYLLEAEVARAALAVAAARRAHLEAGARPEEVAEAEAVLPELLEAVRFAESDLRHLEALAKSEAVPTEAAEKARGVAIGSRSRLEAARARLAMLRAGPTPTELAVARASEAEAAAMLALAEERVAECSTTAPFSGTVTRVHVRPGDLAPAGAALVELVDTTSLRVRFAVSEAEAMVVRKGAEVTVRLDAHPGKPLSGRVDRLYADLDPSSRTRTVEAELLDAVELLPGMFARVDLILGRFPDALHVAEMAVLADPLGRRFLFVVEAGIASRREVKAGIARDGRLQILEGLAAGERVIVAGNERLKDGQEVRAVGARP